MAKDSKSRFDTQRYKATVVTGSRTTDREGRGTAVSSYNPASDAIANQAEAVISFQHVPTGKDVYFKAFITTFSDSLSPSYTEETVFGRTDPIYTFKNTTRNISLNWKVPAASTSEAYENLGKAQTLAQFVYPNYADLGSAGDVNALTISQTPLIRLKVMNLLTNNQKSSNKKDDPVGSGDAGNTPTNKLVEYKSNSDSSNGALGVIKSMTIVHNIENHDIGVLQTAPNTILPKLIEINMSFDVIHEDTLGWQQNKFTNKGFPYEVKLEDEISREDLEKIATFDTLVDQRKEQRKAVALAEQDILNAQARYGTFGGEARKALDAKRIKNLKGKEKLNQRQKDRLEHLESVQRGQQHVDVGNSVGNIDLDLVK